MNSAVYKLLATARLEDEDGTVLSVAVSLGPRRSWRRLKMCTHRLQRQDDRFSRCNQPRGMSMCSRSADACLIRVIIR